MNASNQIPKLDLTRFTDVPKSIRESIVWKDDGEGKEIQVQFPPQVEVNKYRETHLEYLDRSIQLIKQLFEPPDLLDSKKMPLGDNQPR